MKRVEGEAAGRAWVFVGEGWKVESRSPGQPGMELTIRTISSKPSSIEP